MTIYLYKIWDKEKKHYWMEDKKWFGAGHAKNALVQSLKRHCNCPMKWVDQDRYDCHEFEYKELSSRVV